MTLSPMILLEPITRETALVFRDVRLRALSDAPLSFSSTFAKESELSDAEWIKRTERWTSEDAILYLAMDDADGRRACGVVACYAEEGAGGPRGHVISMWVDPRYRRAGVGKLLIDALRSWSQSRGLRELKLMVTSANQGAIEFYRRIGFQMTGATGPYPNDPALIEYEMVSSVGE
jgi:ribosomal protein S18 acetylase RimI-like enzyme